MSRGPTWIPGLVALVALVAAGASPRCVLRESVRLAVSSQEPWGQALGRQVLGQAPGPALAQPPGQALGIDTMVWAPGRALGIDTSWALEQALEVDTMAWGLGQALGIDTMVCWQV